MEQRPRRKRKSRSNPELRKRAKCDLCDWEGELRGVRGHYLFVHGQRATNLEAPEPESTPVPESAPAPEPEPTKRKQSYEEEMGYEN